MVKASGKSVVLFSNIKNILISILKIAFTIAGDLNNCNKNYKISIISSRNCMYLIF